MSRPIPRRTPLLLLAAMATTVLLIAWFGFDTIAAPVAQQPHDHNTSVPDLASAANPAARSTADRHHASRQLGSTEHGQILLTDLTNGNAIANAKVEITYPDQEHETWTSDEDGATPLLPRAGTHLTIEVDGYVPLTGKLDESAATAAKTSLRIGLQPAGTLELRLIGDREEVAPEIVLLPRCPRLGEWAADWRRMVPLFDQLPTPALTDLHRRQDGLWIAPERELHPSAHKASNGLIRIEGLRPSSDYRWALKSGGPAIMAPPHERPTLMENADGQAQIGSSEPEHLSGTFAIRPRETTAFDVQLLTTAYIRGVFPVSGCEVPPQVKLFRMETLQPRSGPAVCHAQELAFVVASEQGGFQFDGLAPGTYAVRAWWRSGQVVQFSSATCVLEAQDVDLGRIDITTGERIFVQLDLQERSTKRTLSPAEALPNVELKLGAVMIQAVPDSKLAHEQVFEALPLAFEQIYELRGFHPGTLALEPRVPPWLQTNRTTSKLQAASGVRGKLEPGALHRLHLIVEPRNEWLLELPEAFRNKPFEVFSRREMDGLAERLEVRGPSGLNDAPYLRVLAPRCNQELFFRELTPPHRIAFVDVHEPPTAPSLQPNFAPSEPVRISCPNVPAGETASWTLPGWQIAQPIWSAAVDPDGATVLHGVPAQRGLAGIGKAPSLPAR